MTDINHVDLTGRLTRDADLTYTNTNLAILKFSIAVNKSRLVNEKWETKTSFFDITVFGKKAESMKKQLLKGKTISLTGELTQNRWEQDGQSRSKVEILADKIIPHVWEKLEKNDEPTSSINDNFEDDIPF